MKLGREYVKEFYFLKIRVLSSGTEVWKIKQCHIYEMEDGHFCQFSVRDNNFC
jgi:hypothetical protein